MSSHPGKPLAGAPLPSFVVNNLDGTTQTLATPSSRWTLLIIYRGKHCGRCKKYLNALESMKDEWDAAGFNIIAVSADSIDKAKQDVEEFGWTFPVAAQLAESDMRNLGLYISDPLTPDEADARFAEPAVFCLRPDASVQIAAISNGPSARPDLAELLDGMIFTINNGKPARGMVG
jgi:peroxiredoxin